MTIQKVAHELLVELKKPLSAKALAELALERGFPSSARDPVQSLAQTLEKNVREGIYNDPELAFVYVNGSRLIGLQAWKVIGPARQTAPPPAAAELSITVPVELLDQIQLAVQAKLADSRDETIALVLREGLATVAPRIKENLMTQLNKL